MPLVLASHNNGEIKRVGRANIDSGLAVRHGVGAYFTERKNG